MSKSSFIMLALSLSLASCGGPTAPPSASRPVVTAGNIAISEPRVRVPVEGRDQTAAYMTLTNIGIRPDQLIRASSTAAASLELHAHIKSSDGMIMMREIKRIELPAGATIPLSPGGLHIMIKSVTSSLKVGETMPITLVFASGTKAQVQVPVVTNPSVVADDTSKGAGGHQH